MYSLVCLVHLSDVAAETTVRAELQELGAAVAPVMEGAFNGGDLAARLTFASEADWRASKDAVDAVLVGPAVARADTALSRDVAGGAANPGMAGGVWRGLLLAANKPQAGERMDQFESELLLMPRYIPAIRNWRLGRVIAATGEANWTHVWEQEYEDLGGLLGPYMLHPYHWAQIDRWFDPECPDWIVDTRLCHSFAQFGRSLLG
ncbi:MAG: Dabb family protein [Proteobacteria bacterium]|nr:Dabb family protein [Pseudomonadota bacterium]